MINKIAFVIRINSNSKYRILIAVLLLLIGNNFFGQVLYVTGHTLVHGENNITIINADSIQSPIVDTYAEVQIKKVYWKTNDPKKRLLRKLANITKKDKINEVSQSIKKQTSNYTILPSKTNRDFSFVYLSLSEKGCVTDQLKRYQSGTLNNYSKLFIHFSGYSVLHYLKYQNNFASVNHRSSFSVRPPPFS